MRKELIFSIVMFLILAFCCSGVFAILSKDRSKDNKDWLENLKKFVIKKKP